MSLVNRQMEQHLQKWIDQETVPHSLLFTGSPHSPVESAALTFGKKLAGPPDLYLAYPEGKLGLHTMEAMRALRDEVYRPPYQFKKKVFVIFSAERMLAPSANALLKTFEEPLVTSSIILVSFYPENLLPTVRSRCQTIHFQEEEVQPKKFIPHLHLILSHFKTMGAIDLLDSIGKLTELLELEALIDPVAAIKEESAYQKSAREKETEGKEALKLSSVTEALWIALYSWYRDLHAVHLCMPKKALLNPSMQAELQNSVNRGLLPDLDRVQKEIEKAKVAFGRSIPLKNVLESLFFALHSLA